MKTYLVQLTPAGKTLVLPFSDLPAAKAMAAGEWEAGTRLYTLQGANDLATASSAELVALHNGLLPEGGNKTSNFDDLKKGAKKVFAMVLKACITSPVPGDQAPAAGTEESIPPASVKPKRQKTMATKTKKTPAKKAAKKAAKKSATPRVKAPAFIEIGNGAPPAGTTCGLFIRSLIMKGATTEDILAKVKKHYPDSTAKGSDVSWNRQKLRADGIKNVPDARVAKEE